MYPHGFISSLKLPRDCSYNLRNNYIFAIFLNVPKSPPLSHFITIEIVGSNTLDTREQLTDAGFGTLIHQLGSENVKLSCICPLQFICSTLRQTEVPWSA